MTKVLDRINGPNDLRSLNTGELASLAAEIREQMVKVISANGGHLASSLGTVELTLALHRVFQSPRDKIIWDVGHQAYAHKLITGRKERFDSIRQYNGLSGFPVVSESQHDAFGAGHAGTSISAALGIALARDLKKENYNVIAVIGDGSLSSGMAFEAVNHAGHSGNRLIVVLNDNGMSISPSVGAFSRWLSRVRVDARYEEAKNRAKRAIKRLPFGQSAWGLSKRVKKNVGRVILPNAFWEEMGFTYLGPLDGHDIREIEAALTRAKDFERGPVLVHVLTQKGRGFAAAESDVIRYHGISPRVPVPSTSDSYSRVFGETVCRLMQDDERVVVISAAMLDGTGLAGAAQRYPRRVFDVGICEQHAVTLAAGLASQGLVPIVAIYSTFLQRAYDQIVHDVCVQNLPVVFAVDRAGIVGEDGRTHQGLLDVSFLRSIPNMVIAAPSDESELQHLLYTGVRSGGPFAVRYPRGNGVGVSLAREFHELPIGKGELIREGKDLTIVAFGPAVHSAYGAAAKLSREGVECAVVNARFAKPLDSDLLLARASQTPNFLTVEENTLCGGFGSGVLELVNQTGLADIKVRCLAVPDVFVDHGPQETFRRLYDLDAEGIIRCVHAQFPELLSRLPVSRQEGV